MISRPMPPSSAGGDLRDDRADHRRGGRQPQRRDQVRHDGRQLEPQQRLPPAGCGAAEVFGMRGARRLQPAQHSDRDREERQVGRDHRHRHPGLPVERADRRALPPQPSRAGPARSAGRSGRGRSYGSSARSAIREPVHQQRQREPDQDADREPGRRPPQRVQRTVADGVEHGLRRAEADRGRRPPAGRRRARSRTRAASSVVGARQHPRTEQLHAVGRRPGLVRLPDRRRSGEPEHDHQRAPAARATRSRRVTALAVTARVDGRDDLLAVGRQRGVLGVVLQVERELVDAEVAQLGQPLDLLLDRPDEAEPVDDLVRDEVGVRVAGLAVRVVVVALPAGDVVGQRLRDRGAVRAVAGDDVGDVVADHAAEPAALVAAVRQAVVGAVGDVGGRGDADRDRRRVAAGVRRGLAHRRDRPLGDRRVGELQDEPVGDLAGQRERLRAVGGHPDRQPGRRAPREPQRLPLYVDLLAVAERPDDLDRLAQRRQRHRLAVDHPHRRVAAADAADRPVAEHVVQRGEQRRGDRPVAGGRVGDHRPDRHPVRGGQDLAVDDVRLLPEQVRVERPDVAEAVASRPARRGRRPARPAGRSAGRLRSPRALASDQVLREAALDELAVRPSSRRTRRRP